MSARARPPTTSPTTAVPGQTRSSRERMTGFLERPTVGAVACLVGAGLLAILPAAIRGYPELVLALGGPAWSTARLLHRRAVPSVWCWPLGLVYSLVGWTLLGTASLWLAVPLGRLSALVLLAVLLGAPTLVGLWFNDPSGLDLREGDDGPGPGL